MRLQKFASILTAVQNTILAGTRQAFLPGGLRTGAPGEYYGSTKARYRLLDEKVRVFIAPPVEEINNSRVRLLPR